MKIHTDGMIKERRQNFNAHTREKFLGSTDSRSFHKGVKAFLSADEAAKWDPRSLFPGKNDKEVANVLAEYFNSISEEYRPLDRDTVPASYDRDFPIITKAEVARRLRKARKTSSMVDGDIFSSLYDVYADSLSEPIACVFNKIVQEQCWATAWRTEYIAVIPKVPSPLDPGECRNIACTNF